MRIMAQHECRGQRKVGEKTGSPVLRGYEYYIDLRIILQILALSFRLFAVCQDIQS